METASHAGHCPVNWNRAVYKVYGEQDKSDENRTKCPAVGSSFPHFRLKPSDGIVSGELKVTRNTG